MSLTSACEDLTAEARALRDLVEPLTEAQSLEVTSFREWRVRDAIVHLVVIDRLALLTLSDPQAFEAELVLFHQATRAPDATTPNGEVFRRMADYEDSRFGCLSWEQLLAAWGVGLAQLCQVARVGEMDAKIKWFGSSMRLQTLLNARQMEVWAYGQDVFDLYQTVRPEGARLRNVAEFAVRTFGFSFANRGLAVPEARPYLALTAPSGARWTWNDPEAKDRIEGSATEFCLVATQRRHPADTALNIRGPIAENWMRIAQCISGPPLDGPRPGERAVPTTGA